MGFNSVFKGLKHFHTSGLFLYNGYRVFPGG